MLIPKNIFLKFGPLRRISSPRTRIRHCPHFYIQGIGGFFFLQKSVRVKPRFVATLPLGVGGAQPAILPGTANGPTFRAEFWADFSARFFFPKSGTMSGHRSQPRKSTQWFKLKEVVFWNGMFCFLKVACCRNFSFFS